MQKELLPKAEQFAQQNKRRSIWRKLVRAMACVVVFCTTYALILPAITLERENCTLEEHIHSDSCYRKITSREQTSLLCSYETLQIHTHTEQCRDAGQNLICGMADFVLHEHDASCFHENGTLVCVLPEIQEHQHSEECYEIPQTEEHSHTDACYAVQRGALLCQMEEYEGHTHTGECMIRGDLICQQEETETHAHGDDCYASIPNCGQEESQGHFHEDACYEQIMELTCELAETEPAEPVLICGKEEIQLHIHQEGSCYEISLDENGIPQKRLICGKNAVENHIHGEGCFVTETVPMENMGTITCGLEESEDHSHSDLCYGTWELICDKEEHTHITDCEGFSGPVGYAYHGTTAMKFTVPRVEDSKTYHSDIAPLFTGIQIIDSKNNLVYDSDNPDLGSNSVFLGEKCRIILYFKEDTSNQFETSGDGTLTYVIPPNLASDIVDTGVILNRENQVVANYRINNNELIITPVLINGDNFFGEYNDVSLQIEFDAEVVQSSDSDYTEIKFDNNHEIKIQVVEDGSLDSQKKQLHYDPSTQTITYECTATAYGGTVSLRYIDDWWWPANISVIQDSIQIKDSLGNDITDGWTYSADAAYFLLRPASPLTLKHGESITLTYQVKVNEGVKDNFLFTNEFAVHGNAGEKDLYDVDSEQTQVEFTNVEKTGIYVREGENDTVQDAIEWTVEVDNSDLNEITITDRLGPRQTFCHHKPIYIRGIRTDTTREEFSIDWNDTTVVTVNEANNQFVLKLPVEALGDGRCNFVEYKVVYYSHYTLDEDGPDVQVFDNTVETNILIGDRPSSDTASVGVLGVPPGISKEVTAADDEWLTFTIECFMPAGLNNRNSVLLYDTLASWGAVDGYIEQNPDSLTVTVSPEGGTPYELQRYVGQESADNTYLLGPDGQSFTMFFNTAQPNSDTSVWKCDVDSTLTISYRISMDAPMLDSWGGIHNGETLREFLERTGQKIQNEAQLNYSPTDVIKDSVSWAPPKQPEPYLRKTATPGQADGVYDYSVWFDTGDTYTCIFKETWYESSNGTWKSKSDIQSLQLTDTFDSRMEYVPGSLKVLVRDAWDHNKVIQVYLLDTGKVPAITTGEDTTTMVISAADLMGAEGYTDWLANRPLIYGLEYLRPGYQYEFTYQLRVKEEIRESSTEGVLEMDNTASVTWADSDGPQTVDPAHNRIFYDTGNLQKDMQTIDNTNLVHFSILINHNALDLAADGDTYVLYDTMSPNLALLYDTLSVQILDEETGNLEGVLTPMDCHFAYNPDENKITLHLPDEKVIRINYNCAVHGIGGETVEIQNAVELNGRSLIQDLVDTQFYIHDHQGSADASSEAFYLQKQDGNNHNSLAGVTFHLYGDVQSETPDDFIVIGNRKFYYLTSHTTDSNGISYIDDSQLTAGHMYVLVEDSPPDGYVALEEPFVFYMEKRPPGGDSEIPCIVNGQLVVIENFPPGYELPATGGAGTTSYTMGGLLLMMAAAILLYSHSSKRRKEGKPSF